jgi:YVTN family beta-propeller protein
VCIAAGLASLVAAGCNRHPFPVTPPGYREFAYVSNGGSNSVSVLDLVNLRQDRTLQVGAQPAGLAANPKRDEVYVVNTRSGTVSVIDTNLNQVVATIPVRKLPYFIDVDATGQRAYVANSGSNSVSVIDLDARREIGVLGAGEQPGVARVSADGRSLVVSNRGSGSVSIYGMEPQPEKGPGLGIPLLSGNNAAGKKSTSADLPKLRATFAGCPGATDIAILPFSTKAFIACSGGHQVMAVALAQAADSRAVKQNPSLATDRMLALLDVGKAPVQLALKPDGGQIFCANFDSDSISSIDTESDEVTRTDTIADGPVRGIVSKDDSTLWVANFGADSINLWSIDDSQALSGVRTGRAPDAMAFSADEHLLLAADAKSGDVSVIRTQDKNGPELFTMLPAGASPNDIVVKAMPGKR